MSGINYFLPPTAQQPPVNNQSQIHKTSSSDRTLKTATTEAATVVESQISSFSQALSDVATRAAERDATSTRDELSKIAYATITKLSGDSYQQNKTAYDVELPNPDDPQRLAQAQQATNYTNGKGNNPFEGMPPDQLSLIIYDESGTFTTNERRAASRESYSQHLAWQIAISAKIMDDWSRNRTISSGLYQEALDYYKALPPIEESQLLEGYEADFQALINQSAPDLPQNNNRLESFFDLLIKRLNDHQPGSAHL
ncbi:MULTISPECIES: hypothetical protein [unclassified Pseudomonas]|uniref:hypothetical protein n=1 Tax=unclassified Pseudomonas TaxID=196821 RepID=UPI000BD264E8|nr:MULTISPECIES: hypothetical protein [unclassified Pseudomonas]PVZ20405.1 hypothetical protein F474_01005 [Pseudomonas sp. URIL14HWK12:I12]PVZ27471.1 hypothetical protein F470_00660 [Pseudomonas sp. URIL14HWK12:I10]PVZ38360.1 hypothetical protein F472_01005 [Pseudomonas sp. URIL14HWK12:I11]SNZ03668.1 hypothetical protein SAMN05660463_00399 [Pseudomonas sp. URIL14HWK12:I9]